jgi:hypothetical protein
LIFIKIFQICYDGFSNFHIKYSTLRLDAVSVEFDVFLLYFLGEHYDKCDGPFVIYVVL